MHPRFQPAHAPIPNRLAPRPDPGARSADERRDRPSRLRGLRHHAIRCDEADAEIRDLLRRS